MKKIRKRLLRLFPPGAAMRRAVGQGPIEGTSHSTLTPSGDSARIQAAAVLMRFCEEITE